MPDAQELDHLFHALSDRTRRAILSRLAQGEATVNELCQPFNLKRPTISKHLKVLEHAGLIRTRRRAQFRAKALDIRHLTVASNWIETCRAHWEASFDRLDTYVNALEERDGNDAE